MKITVLQENLNKGLGVVQRFVATRGQLPILANVLISAEQGRLKLAATNLELGIVYWVGAKVEQEGQITVPARAVAEWVASLPKERIEIEVDKEKLKLSCGGYKGEFRGIGAAEFPEMPEKAGKGWASFKLEEIEAAVEQVAFAAATDEGRPVLTGVRWKFTAEGMEWVATDGYRLSVKMLKLSNSKLQITNKDKTLIIPARALMEAVQVGRSGGEDKATVEIGEVKGGGQMMFDWGDVQVMTRLLAGEFPEVEKVIPKTAETEMVIETEELMAAVRGAAIFARDSANLVKWEVGKEGLTISANSPAVGENQIKVEAKVSGEGGTIAFNSRYVLEMLGAVKGKEMIFEMTGALNPGVFKVAGDEDWRHVIMPVRVQGAEGGS